MKGSIDAMTDADWPEVRTIYAEGIQTGLATFETDTPDWAAWHRGHLADCRWVLRRGGRIVGWAALVQVSPRQVYSGVAEVSIYVAREARGQGLGRALLERLIESSEAHGFWTLQAGIFRENSASLALHSACGFREVGVRERIGRLHGRWMDVVLLERRSSRVGRADEA